MRWIRRCVVLGRWSNGSTLVRFHLDEERKENNETLQAKYGLALVEFRDSRAMRRPQAPRVDLQIRLLMDPDKLPQESSSVEVAKIVPHGYDAAGRSHEGDVIMDRDFNPLFTERKAAQKMILSALYEVLIPDRFVKVNPENSPIGLPDLMLDPNTFLALRHDNEDIRVHRTSWMNDRASGNPTRTWNPSYPPDGFEPSVIGWLSFLNSTWELRAASQRPIYDDKHQCVHCTFQFQYWLGGTILYRIELDLASLTWSVALSVTKVVKREKSETWDQKTLYHEVLAQGHETPLEALMAADLVVEPTAAAQAAWLEARLEHAPTFTWASTALQQAVATSRMLGVNPLLALDDIFWPWAQALGLLEPEQELHHDRL